MSGMNLLQLLAASGKPKPDPKGPSGWAKTLSDAAAHAVPTGGPQSFADWLKQQPGDSGGQGGFGPIGGVHLPSSGIPTTHNTNPSLFDLISNRASGAAAGFGAGQTAGNVAAAGGLGDAIGQLIGQGGAAAGSGNSVLDQLTALLQGGPPSGGGVAMPSEATYTMPYDNAAAAAKIADAAGQTNIKQTYADLQNQLKAQAGQQASDQARAAASDAARSAAINQTAAALQAGPSILSGAPAGASDSAAIAKQTQGNLTQSQAAAQQLAADRAATARSDAAGAQTDASGAQGAALANAQNNLSAMLNQIGLQKAGAERQYLSDSASASQANAQAAQSQYGNKVSALETLLKMQQTGAGSAGTATQSGRDWLNSPTVAAQLGSSYPKTLDAFGQLIGAQDTPSKTDPTKTIHVAGATTSGEAMSRLEQSIPYLKSGKFNGTKFDDAAISRLRQLIGLYFSTSKASSPTATGDYGLLQAGQ